MINPTDDDIGREVIYTAKHHGAKPESGVITSFNEHIVFVRYGRDTLSKGTAREDLNWAYIRHKQIGFQT